MSSFRHTESVPTAGAAGGFAKIVRRTADSATITAQATPQNDDTLLWAVGASDVWWFELFALFTAADSTGAATTADLAMSFSLPTGGSMKWGALGNQGNSVAGFGWTGAANSPNAVHAASVAIASGMAAVTVGVAFGGIYVGDGSHAGTVTFQWSQNVSNAATLQINANSFLRLTRLA